MKSADITPGWYQYDSSPNGRYGRDRRKVYVFGPAPKYVKGHGYFRPFDVDSEEEPLTTVIEPETGATLKVPAQVKSHRYGRDKTTQWIVGVLRTGVKDDVYETDADGNYVEDEDGDWVVKETRVLPDYWEFAVVRSVTIIQSWDEHERLEAARKAWQAEEAEREEKRRAERATANEALVASLAEYGLELLDILDRNEAKSVVHGTDGGNTRAKIDAALRLAKKVADHTTTAVLAVHR